MDTPNVVQVVGSLAYLVDRLGQLQVVDVTDPAHPTGVAMRQAGGYIKGLRVKDTSLYVVGDQEGADHDVGFLEIFNLSQPTNPVSVGFSFTGAPIGYGVDVANGHAYIANDESALTVVNVSAETNWPVVAEFTTYGWAEAVQLRGDYAFLVGEFLGLTVLDVSDPADPAKVAQYPIGTGRDEGWDVHVVGNYAYVARGDLGLLIFQIDETRYFTSISRVGDKLTLRWNGTRALKLQHSASVSSTVWEDVPGSDGLSSMDLPIGNGNDFFRLSRE